jgi:phage shock protein E
MKELVVDLRSEEEYNKGHLPEAVNIPHEEFIRLADRGELDEDTQYLLHCRTGNRTALVLRTVKGYALLDVQERFDSFAKQHPESL